MIGADPSREEPMRAAGALSLVVLVLSWLALDDITTDNATTFRVEYAMLVLAGLWFAWLGVALIRKGRAAAGAVSLAAVGLGVIAFWSLPHHYQPASMVNLLGLAPLAWFLGLSIWLAAGSRSRQPSVAVGAK
jgi:peptidoglycan/LPS O-acetylase OafA/YrhL